MNVVGIADEPGVAAPESCGVVRGVVAEPPTRAGSGEPDRENAENHPLAGGIGLGSRWDGCGGVGCWGHGGFSILT